MLKFIRTFDEEENECLIPVSTVERITCYDDPDEDEYSLVISATDGLFSADYVDKDARDAEFNMLNTRLNG